MKACNNCYWKFKINRWCIDKEIEPNEKICNKHTYKCNQCGDQATYEYLNYMYCTECLFKEMNVESYTITHYMKDGEYLGCEDEMDLVLDKLDENIKQLE